MIHWVVEWGAGVVGGAVTALWYHKRSGMVGDQYLTVWYGGCWLVILYAAGFWLMGWVGLPTVTVGLAVWTAVLDWRARRSVKKRERGDG